MLRLTFDGTHCIGVVYRKDGAEHAVHANREVILCGGAINSPQLLMLSGIGPKEALQALGIDVLVDLPGVGQNLEDHLFVPVAYHCTEPVSLALAGSDAEVKKFPEDQGAPRTELSPLRSGGLPAAGSHPCCASL